MKAEIDINGVLIIHPETIAEEEHLQKWYDDNPVNELDGLKLRFDMDKKEKEK